MHFRRPSRVGSVTVPRYAIFGINGACPGFGAHTDFGSPQAIFACCDQGTGLRPRGRGLAFGTWERKIPSWNAATAWQANSK
jgi:hypothetical protein